MYYRQNGMVIPEVRENFEIVRTADMNKIFAGVMVFTMILVIAILILLINIYKKFLQK